MDRFSDVGSTPTGSTKCYSDEHLKMIKLRALTILQVFVFYYFCGRFALFAAVVVGDVGEIMESQGLTYTKAVDEVATEGCERMLENSKALSEFAKDHKSIFEKIKENVEKFLSRIRDAVKALYGNERADVRSVAHELEAYADEMQEIFDKALRNTLEASAATVDRSVQSNANEKAPAPVGEVQSKKANQYSEYDKPITIEDVIALRSIISAHNLENGERLSINDFTSEDIQKAQKWAYKFYKELGAKSPFFRAWFGDWRAYDTIKKNVVSVPTIDISQASLKHGDYEITDTGWVVHAGKILDGDTRHHTGGSKINVKSLNSIEKILSNAVLLDTIVSEPDTKKKSPNTAFLHKLYTVIEYDNRTYLAKTTIEEYYNETISGVSQRAYNLKTIKIEPTGGQLGEISSSSKPNIDSMYSISDLFALVKEYDKEFKPKPVHEVLTNEDGTPRIFYHGTNAKFTEFSPDEFAPMEGSYFFAENREDAEAYGDNLFEVYLTGKKLADYDNQPSEFYKLRNKRLQVEYLKERGYDGWYADMDSGGWGEISVFSPEQIKSATDNIGTFDRGQKDIQYRRKKNTLVEALRKDAKTEYEREILDRYEAKEDEISQMKTELDVTAQILNNIRYIPYEAKVKTELSTVRESLKDARAELREAEKDFDRLYNDDTGADYNVRRAGDSVSDELTQRKADTKKELQAAKERYENALKKVKELEKREKELKKSRVSTEAAKRINSQLLSREESRIENLENRLNELTKKQEEYAHTYKPTEKQTEDAKLITKLLGEQIKSIKTSLEKAKARKNTLEQATAQIEEALSIEDAEDVLQKMRIELSREINAEESRLLQLPKLKIFRDLIERERRTVRNRSSTINDMCKHQLSQST